MINNSTTAATPRPHPTTTKAFINRFSTKAYSARAIEMAEAMIDIRSLHGNVQQADLIASGFTSSEIIEHQAEAAQIASDKHTRVTIPTRHSLTDMAYNIRMAAPTKPAKLDDEGLTPEQQGAWNAYCSTRTAYMLDPWHVLRERCITQLLGYLLMLSIPPVNRQKLVDTLNKQLPKAAVEAGR